MVEDDGECILQWSGHAGYITERFSGLLARQALVDVTLICEEQKLRVHKLVLASNSAYFEEILEQDLGHEPIIFLRDLNFEILKSMVEFMYCGETTIAHEHLPSLLSAAQIFKVKELAGIINAVTESDKDAEESEGSSISPSDISESDQMDSYDENECTHKDCVEPDQNRCMQLCANANKNTSLLQRQSLEDSIIVNNPEEQLDHTLYEESCELKTGVEESGALLSVDSAKDQVPSLKCTTLHLKVNETGSGQVKPVDEMPLHCTNKELKPLAYEQCCDFNETNKREEACPRQVNGKLGSCSVKQTDVPNNVEKSVKVYTHKKRKSVDKPDNNAEHSSSLARSLPPSTDCIDLLDEPSSSNVPVTLLTSLDMESAEYILSLSTENIQSILGCAMSDQNTLIKYKGEGAADDEELSLVYDKPVLRRSSRLHQQENEEPGSVSIRQIETGKSLKKSSGCSKSDAKSKRRAKELDRRVPDQNVLQRVSPSRKNLSSSRTHRNASKLIVRKHKSLCTAIAKERGETRPPRAATSRTKLDLSGSVRPLNLPASKPGNLNVVGCINRALWGDMSDASEELKNEIRVSGSVQNTEIPFALGLLPLRTALEKMQATPDYQPRKTRSSVALVKQDHEANGLKRKQCFDPEPRRHGGSNNDGASGNANTVCHIQIRTAPSRYAKIRKTAHINNLTSVAVTNG